MSHYIHHSLCPLCGSSEIKKVTRAIDHTVSGEEYIIWECSDCTLRFTQDAPDEASIGKYYRSENYISHSNTSKGIINRIYKVVRKRSITQKIKLIRKSTGLSKGTLLDVGSGTGSFAAAMQKHGWEVTGLEPDETARHVAEQHNGIRLDSMEMLFKLPEATFDAITLWHVLEHVHDLHAYLRQFKKLLKPNGRLIIAVPNFTSFDSTIFQENWAAYDVPRHLYHFSPTSMKRLLQMVDMNIIKKKQMWYDSFYVSLLSSRYQNGRTNWLSATWTGMLSNIKALDDPDRCSSIIYIAAIND